MKQIEDSSTLTGNAIHNLSMSLRDWNNDKKQKVGIFSDIESNKKLSFILQHGYSYKHQEKKHYRTHERPKYGIKRKSLSEISGLTTDNIKCNAS